MTAVDRVSLAVMPGETLAIVGESGSGKSTLGRLLLRLLAASEGRVFYQGEEITHASGARLNQLRRELQIIFQDPFASLNPRMTVEQIVGEPLWLHQNMKKADRQYRVAELLKTVGLPAAWAGRYPHEFSGGQRQRIGIARALASGPKLLLGDEPVSALDVSVQAQVVNLLESLKHQLGLTMVIVAHGLAVIRHMSDRVAVMYLGQIVELATVDEIFDAPLHPYTQALIARRRRCSRALRMRRCCRGTYRTLPARRPAVVSTPAARTLPTNAARSSRLIRCSMAGVRLPAIAGRRSTAIAALFRSHRHPPLFCAAARCLNTRPPTHPFLQGTHDNDNA